MNPPEGGGFPAVALRRRPSATHGDSKTDVRGSH